ncbi:hypothetical protein B296_00037322 [Ensete ventricosum]|uniref:Retrotransposon gag domain-containing protein n=1 Tax=Ensete ventricosum TaxID=4639 RepID=A0A426ZZW5_ENSVE|nr:hypothetical protein B296_00037322 [Ensete ventricosum]
MPLTRQQKKDLNITDLEAYTMATEEAINVKFEALETSMEEKIRTIVAELSMGGQGNHSTPEIRGVVKARQPYTHIAAISFARLQEERLNHEARRTMVAPRPTMSKPSAPSTVIRAPATKKLTRDELRERSAKGLCWHCDEPWSRERRCKKGRLLVIEPVEDKDNEPPEESLEPEEVKEEEPQSADFTMHALAGYSNP